MCMYARVRVYACVRAHLFCVCMPVGEIPKAKGPKKILSRTQFPPVYQEPVRGPFLTGMFSR